MLNISESPRRNSRSGGKWTSRQRRRRFPNWAKMDFGVKSAGTPKYIVANLDEGDPGVFANRTLAEADPHAIIEGMLIGAFAIGAEKGYVYIRSEYPLAIQTLVKAIAQAKVMSLLGNNILETNFKFDLELRFGAGAFVAGEETAILASVEGQRAMPRPRPPYPANSGLWKSPHLSRTLKHSQTSPKLYKMAVHGSRKQAHRNAQEPSAFL